MAQRLSGKQIAILATHGFEQSELTEPKRLLEAQGAQVSVVSPAKEATIKGWKEKNWGDAVAVDFPLAEADAGHFDALVLPGGVINPDTLRTDEAALDFIRKVAEAGKPVAAICHGPWLLVDSGLAKDISGSARDRAIVRGIIDIAKSIDLKVIAEGVENERQLFALARAGCDYYQGFLRSPAVDTDTLVKLVRAASS